MKIHSQSQGGLTLIELSVTMGLVGVLGLIIYSLLNIGTILGAKNTAVNTAHQQARVAMLQMTQDLHAAISLPFLFDVDASGTPVWDATLPAGVQVPALSKGPAGGPAAGIAFQQWSGGPYKIVPKADPSPAAGYPAGQKVIHIIVTSGAAPIAGQRLIVPTHQIEDRISSVSGGNGDLTVTLDNNLPVDIRGTTSAAGDIVCYASDRCWYFIANNGLTWHRQGDRVMVTDITNTKPFSTPSTPAGALYYRFVAAIDLSTADLNYTNRGYKAANILLNGLVPFKGRLTTYQ
jgi:prepilin-type N-terminal cleavage/methylation domain-containing protein